MGVSTPLFSSVWNKSYYDISATHTQTSTASEIFTNGTDASLQGFFHYVFMHLLDTDTAQSI